MLTTGASNSITTSESISSSNADTNTSIASSFSSKELISKSKLVISTPSSLMNLAYTSTKFLKIWISPIFPGKFSQLIFARIDTLLPNSSTINRSSSFIKSNFNKTLVINSFLVESSPKMFNVKSSSMIDFIAAIAFSLWISICLRSKEMAFKSATANFAIVTRDVKSSFQSSTVKALRFNKLTNSPYSPSPSLWSIIASKTGTIITLNNWVSTKLSNTATVTLNFSTTNLLTKSVISASVNSVMLSIP